MGQAQFQQQPNQEPQKTEEKKLKKAKKAEEPVVHREIERIYPAPELGLTGPQALELEANGYSNTAVVSNAKTTGQIIRENTLTFFNMVFLVLAVLLIIANNAKFEALSKKQQRIVKSKQAKFEKQAKATPKILKKAGAVEFLGRSALPYGKKKALKAQAQKKAQPAKKQNAPKKAKK